MTYSWTDNAMVDGVSTCLPDVINENLMHLKYENNIAANTTIYVATIGNDTTGNGSVSAPYATIHKALSSLTGKTLLGTVTIQVADGTYTFSNPILLEHPQSFWISIRGNTTTPSNCILNFTGTYDAIYTENHYLNINGFKLVGTRAVTQAGITLRFNGSALIGSKMIIDGFNNGLSVEKSSCAFCYAGVVIQNCVNASIVASTSSSVIFEGCTATGYASPKTNVGVAVYAGSYVSVISSAITNATTGSLAIDGAQIADTSGTYTSCTTARSPASNTVGNGNSYIKT